MPATRFYIQWPDGKEESCYSPSTIIHEYLKTGAEYSLSEFEQLCDTALNEASERVRKKFGFACSSALDQLATIKHRTNQLKLNYLAENSHSKVTVIRMEADI